MYDRKRLLRTGLGAALAALALAPPASAYVGPGAGFAAAGGVLVLLGTFLLAFAVVLMWPIKAVYRLVRRVGYPKPKVRRVVILGLDGFDPGLARRFAAEGRMPNFQKLAEEGCFHELLSRS